MKTSKKILVWLACFITYSALSQNAQKPDSENTVSDISSEAYGLWSPNTLELKSTQAQSNSLLTVENNNPGFSQNLVNFSSIGTNSTLHVLNSGTDGNAGFFYSLNNSNFSPTVLSRSSGGGNSFVAESFGTGKAAEFVISNNLNISDVISSYTNGSGANAFFQQAGTGYGLSIDLSNPASTGMATRIENAGLGHGLYVANSNTSNNNPAIRGISSSYGAGIMGITTGTGFAGDFRILSSSSVGSSLNAMTQGLGSAGIFEVANVSNIFPALKVSSNGSGASIRAFNNGSGRSIEVINSGVSNLSDGIYVSNTGYGSGIYAKGHNGAAIEGEAMGTNTSIYGHTNSSDGQAGHFKTSDSNNGKSTILVENNGTGSGIWTKTTGTARTAIFQNLSETNSKDLIFGQNLGIGNGIYVQINNESNTATALLAETNGNGNALIANHTNSNTSSTSENNIAIFKSQGFNKARIDKDGKAYFNGGTQNSGADIAEAFEVEDDVTQYEPGDVLVISIDSDRKVVKSTTAYSPLVAGVYATKPGVLLTEENMDSDLSGHIPMGVMGVIPTKVCNEGGPIKRGDLLVSSSILGYAMKADMNKVGFGQILGKALQNFDKTEGKINVLIGLK